MGVAFSEQTIFFGSLLWGLVKSVVGIWLKWRWPRWLPAVPVGAAGGGCVGAAGGGRGMPPAEAHLQSLILQLQSQLHQLQSLLLQH